MSKLSLLKTLLVSTSCILLFACATTQPQPVETTPEASVKQTLEHPSVAQLSAEERSQLYFSILLGDIANKQHLYDVARSNFYYAAEQTGSKDLSRKAAMIALVERDYSHTTDAITLWLQSDDKDKNAYKIAIIASLAQGKVKASKMYLQRLLPLLPNDDDDKLYELTQMASFQESADFINFFEHLNTPLDSPYYAATEAYLRLKSATPKKYYERIQQLLTYTLSQKPNFLSVIKLKGEAFALDSKQKQAQYLQSVLEENDLNLDQTYAIGELLYTQNSYRSALKAFHRVFDQRPNDRQTQFLIASSFYALEQYQQASEMFWQLTQQSFKQDISSYYCADSAARVNDLDKAYSCYKQVPAGHYYMTARIELAQLYAENKRMEQALKSLRQAQRKVGLNDRQRLLEFEINLLTQTGDYKQAKQRIMSALQVSPNKPFLYYLKLQLFNQTQSVTEFKQSIEQLQSQANDPQLRNAITLMGANFLQARNSYLMAYQLLEEAVKNHPDDIELLYSRALAAEPLEYYSSMERDLRRVLELDPDNVSAKNSLGYTLADLNHSLEEAQSLIESAYQQQPDNVAIQDSMGWINYRIGNYEEALKYLNMAYEQNASPEIASHLGVVLWNMDLQQKAIQVWRKALRLAPNNQYILRTLRRFPESNLLKR